MGLAGPRAHAVAPSPRQGSRPERRRQRLLPQRAPGSPEAGHGTPTQRGPRQGDPSQATPRAPMGRPKRRVQLSRLRTVAPGLLCSPLPLSCLCLPERPPSLGQGRLPPPPPGVCQPFRASAGRPRVRGPLLHRPHSLGQHSLLTAFRWVNILATIFPAGCLLFSTIPFMSSVSGTLSPLPTHPLVSLLGSLAFSHCLLRTLLSLGPLCSSCPSRRAPGTRCPRPVGAAARCDADCDDLVPDPAEPLGSS